MDEPDAYLSSQGQQDLMRILEAFAAPEDERRRDQVVYVTHSPFLINRNAADRIRVLDKGSTDEGTRVVRDVARNHYEPLRSALGPFVAETSFIGGSNLFVEGTSDQVLLAGFSTHLRRHGAGLLDVLDLNEITIVPSGSSSSIPYLVYLARGRDVVRPPCVALLDGDEAGADAAKALSRGGARNKEILPKRYIVNVGDWAAKERRVALDSAVTAREPEDLIALPVVIAAARSYAERFLDADLAKVKGLDTTALQAALPKTNGSVFDALDQTFSAALGADAHIEKVGFAREVVATLDEARANGATIDGLAETVENFGALLSHLAETLRAAQREESDRRINNRLERTIKSFLTDHQTAPRRERGRLLLEEVKNSVERSEAGDQVRLRADSIRRDFELDESLNEPIQNFDDFRTRVQGLQYEERFVNQEAAAVEPAVPDPAITGSDEVADPAIDDPAVATPAANASTSTTSTTKSP